MIHEDAFRISKSPYAIKLDSLVISSSGDPAQAQVVSHRIEIDAVWFRRRSGITRAVIGTLWDYQTGTRPTGVYDALGRHVDGRYGGAWIARWDGTAYVSENPQPPELVETHMAILRPMLDNYPAVPEGYQGWWRF